jgi:hypothetical protein
MKNAHFIDKFAHFGAYKRLGFGVKMGIFI